MLIETQLPGIVNHADMNGLANDDHTQYLLADGSRYADELTIGASVQGYIYTSGNNICVYSDAGDIYLEPTTRVQIYGGLYLTGLEFTLGYDGLRIRQNNSTYAAEYDSWDKNEHYFQYQGTDLFAVKSTGIYIYGGGDSANLKVVSNDFEIWGGMGDIVLYPYDYTIAHYLLAPDGIKFDTTGDEIIYSSTGDMFFEAYYGFTFYGSNPLQSMGGFRSSAGNDGVTQSVDYSGGTMYFEDGLLVYVAMY